jgi:hypothetical protein
MLHSPGEHKVGLTQCKVGPHHFEVPLVFFDFDCEMCDVIIDLPVPCDLSCQTPVVDLGHGVLEEVEVTPWSHE